MGYCCADIWSGWVKICAAINRFFERTFMKWAYIAGTHPKKVIAIGCFIAIGLGIGFLRFNLQMQGERLYFPDKSQSKTHLNRADKSFPQKIKPDEFIITMSDEVSSVLNVEAFHTANRIHKRLMTETNVETICIKVNGNVLIISPLFFFNYNESLMTNTSIKQTLINALNNNKLLMPNGQPASLGLSSVLGSLKATNSSVEGSALRVLYYQPFAETDEMYDKISAVQKIMIKIFQEEEKKINAEKKLKIFYNTGISVDDGISESSGGDISMVVVSITLMCVFSTAIFISIRDPPGGHVTAANIGIVSIVLGIGSGFGVVILSGQYFVAFVGTLPFLVLGIGIDDMFIIIDALDAIPQDITGIERLQKTLGKVGASVTMTTITDVVAFAVSSSSQFPAIRYFCSYAATSILFSFIIIMTVMVAFLSIDIKRIESGRWDIIPCKRTQNHIPWTKTLKSTAKKVMRKWAVFLMKNPVRVVVVIIGFALLGGGIYGTLQLDESFDLKQLAPDGSYLIEHQDRQKRYFPVGFPIHIINDDKNFDYTQKEKQQAYMYLSTICIDNKFLVGNARNWMTALFQSSYYDSRLDFYVNLQKFLAENPTYYSDIVFYPGNNKIKYSKIVCRDKDVNDWSFKRDAMVQLRHDIKTKSNISTVFPITMSYFYREQIASVQPETIQNLVLCAVTILVITTPYLVHPLVILIVFGGFVTLILELFGLMAAWGVSLNSISMITSTMAIGFAVDYSAHVAHSYLLADADTPEERMIEALTSTGSSVFMGGFTTFLGVLVLIFGKSEIFRIFFKIMFGIVLIGLLNGLLFLPVFLTLLVRNKVKVTDNEVKPQLKPSIENGHTDYSMDVIPNKQIAVYKNGELENGNIPEDQLTGINDSVNVKTTNEHIDNNGPLGNKHAVVS